MGRRKVIDERCGLPKDLDNASEDSLISICQSYYERVKKLENEKYDMEKEVEYKDYKINELNIAVNDLRGKFIKPTLKKEFTMDEEEAAAKKKPDWALGAKEGEGGAKPP